MIPRLVHQTARTKALTWEENVLTRRTLRTLRGWEYRLWDDRDCLDLVRGSVPQHATQYEAIEKGIVRSDIARYVFLYRFGGLYLDTDYKLFEPLDDLAHNPCILPIELDESQGYQIKLGNAFMMSEAGHPFWLDLLDKIFARGGEFLNTGDPVSQTGPGALTDLWNERRSNHSDIYSPLRTVFFPNFRHLNFSYEKAPDTRGVHLCWGGWRGKKGPELVRNLIRRKTTCWLP